MTGIVPSFKITANVAHPCDTHYQFSVSALCIGVVRRRVWQEPCVSTHVYGTSRWEKEKYEDESVGHGLGAHVTICNAAKWYEEDGN